MKSWAELPEELDDPELCATAAGVVRDKVMAPAMSARKIGFLKKLRPPEIKRNKYREIIYTLTTDITYSGDPPLRSGITCSKIAPHRLGPPRFLFFDFCTNACIPNTATMIAMKKEIRIPMAPTGISPAMPSTLLKANTIRVDRPHFLNLGAALLIPSTATGLSEEWAGQSVVGAGTA